MDRLEILDENASARRRLLDFSDNLGPFRAQRGRKIAAVRPHRLDELA
jgi:hypothetical protein